MARSLRLGETDSATEYDALLRRGYLMLGALAFLSGAALFTPLAIARASSSMGVNGEAIVAGLSVLFVILFGSSLTRELAKP